MQGGCEYCICKLNSIKICSHTHCLTVRLATSSLAVSLLVMLIQSHVFAAQCIIITMIESKSSGVLDMDLEAWTVQYLILHSSKKLIYQHAD